MKIQYLTGAAMALTSLFCPAHATSLFGESYTPCGSQPSTAEMIACVDAKVKIWDRRLSAAYVTLQSKAEPAQRAPLRAAQRAWVQYRNANCRYYGTAEGSIRLLNAAECMRAMTEDRALEIEDVMKP